MGLPFEKLNTEEVNARFPQLHLHPGELGLLQSDAAVVRADVYVSSLEDRCVELGCEVRNWLGWGVGKEGRVGRGVTGEGGALNLSLHSLFLSLSLSLYLFILFLSLSLSLSLSLDDYDENNTNRRKINI